MLTYRSGKFLNTLGSVQLGILLVNTGNLSNRFTKTIWQQRVDTFHKQQEEPKAWLRRCHQNRAKSQLWADLMSFALRLLHVLHSWPCLLKPCSSVAGLLLPTARRPFTFQQHTHHLLQPCCICSRPPSPLFLSSQVTLWRILSHTQT